MLARVVTKLHHLTIESTSAEKKLAGSDVRSRLVLAHIIGASVPDFNHVLHAFYLELYRSGVKPEDGLTISFSNRSFKLQIPMAPAPMQAAESFLAALDRILGTTAFLN